MKNSFKELEKIDYSRTPVRILKFIRLNEKRCFPLHWHDRIELLRIDKGQMNVTCGNNEFVAYEGECIIINPKEVHSAVAINGDVEYTCLMFELTPLSDNIYYGNRFINPLLYRQLRFKNRIMDSRINEMIDNFEKLNKDDSPSVSFHIDAGILLLLSYLIENCINTDYTKRSSDLVFTEVVDYIDNHFADNITIPFLAQRFGYDNSYFCRKFKAQTGLTCVEYINALRLDQAAIMLKGTKAPISEIAITCGFSDANYFSRCFKEKYGISPSKWRDK